MENTVRKGRFQEKFLGDKAFYKMVLAIAIPIMIQNGITNFVSLLDNIMIGRIGTEQMSGGGNREPASFCIQSLPVWRRIWGRDLYRTVCGTEGS